MDNIVDYFTYVVVPAAFIYESHLVPAAWSLVVVGAMLMTSAYQFCQGEAKTADHFFTGFPSYWNLVVLYLFFAEFSPSHKPRHPRRASHRHICPHQIRLPNPNRIFPHPPPSF